MLITDSFTATIEPVVETENASCSLASVRFVDESMGCKLPFGAVIGRHGRSPLSSSSHSLQRSVVPVHNDDDDDDDAVRPFPLFLITQGIQNGLRPQVNSIFFLRSSKELHRPSTFRPTIRSTTNSTSPKRFCFIVLQSKRTFKS